MNELHEFLDEREQVSDERFVVDDDQKANWALRKIKQAQNNIEETNKLADAEVEKIESWANQRNLQEYDTINYFQSLVAEYAMKKKEENPDFKTLKLPNGSFGFRKQQPKWIYDNDTVIDSLEKSGMSDLIRVKKEPSKADIKKMLSVVNGKVVNTETGEVIEGITVEEQPDNFNVRVD